MSVVKRRRKEDPYARIFNQPLQPNFYGEENSLTDLRALGLLSHIMSLPEDWAIYKTQLQKTFSRKNVDAAWKELAQKRFALELILYVDRKKKHFYQVADFQFTQEDYEEFAIEEIERLQKDGSVVQSPKTPDNSPFEITDKITNVLSVHKVKNEKKFDGITNVPLVQYTEYSTKDTPINKKETNEKHTNKILNNIVNKENLVNNETNDSINTSEQETIHKLTNEYRAKGLTKEVCLRVLEHVIDNKDNVENFGAYLRVCLERTLYNHNVKHGLIEQAPTLKERLKNTSIPYYDFS